MVAAEQRLVTEGLGIKHLRLVFGTSTGDMHAWLWGEQYPALMDAIIPVACQPDKIAGRNLLWRRIITTAIRSDPEWNGGDYHQPPPSLARVCPIFQLMASGAARLQKELTSVEQANAFSGLFRRHGVFVHQPTKLALINLDPFDFALAGDRRAELTFHRLGAALQFRH